MYLLKRIFLPDIKDECDIQCFIVFYFLVSIQTRFYWTTYILSSFLLTLINRNSCLLTNFSVYAVPVSIKMVYFYAK